MHITMYMYNKGGFKMALKVTKKTTGKVVNENSGSELGALEKQLKEKTEQVCNLNTEIADIRRQIVAIHLRPFKFGDYVMYEVPAGKTRKMQKCELKYDSENHKVKAVPFKADGSKSNREFFVYLGMNQSYSDVLKKAEE